MFRAVFVATSLIGVVALAAGCATESTTSDPPAVIDLRPGIAVEGNPGEMGTHGDVAADRAAVEAVVMIGDSITKGSRAALEERFALLGLAPVTIEAENGKRMAVSSSDNPSGSSIASFVTSLSDGDHSDELWIVALGTNDVGQYDGPDEIAAAVNEVLARVPTDAPLVWVDVYFRDRPEQQELVNSIIRDRVERRGNSVVAPWAAFATGDDVLTGDGVHPTSDGTEVFAFVVTDTARAFLGR
ncbi:MAG TPA: GDSL-type esterase/lipase family protein [Ilumatobacteraceae bacterium]|nr:GDSL-type esterase/lipase family protein [Ilumatobacteraceae bacterium]